MVSTDAEKLAQIAALMTEPGADGIYRWKVGHVRRRIAAILTEPGPAVPPEGIDRDALTSARRRIAVLYMAGIGGEAAALDLRLAIDEIDAAVALVRPVEGVTITADEAVQARGSLRADAFEIERGGGSAELVARKRALAARLEASA